MRSVISDLYPEPRPGGVQATSSLPSTSALHRLSPVRSATSATEGPSLGARSLSFIRSGVSAVSALFASPRRSAETQRTRSAATPNKGRRRPGRPARSRTQSGTGVSSPRRTAGTVSDGDSPRQPASREALTGGETSTGPAEQRVDRADRPAQQEDQIPAQQTEQTPNQRPDQTPDPTPEQQTDQTSVQPTDQPSVQHTDHSENETPDQHAGQEQGPSSREPSATPLSRDHDLSPSGAEDPDLEGHSAASETGGHTDTERIDVIEDGASLDSEPFSSGPDDDGDSQRGLSQTTASNADDSQTVSTRGSRRVTFDESAPETLVFTPEQGGGRRGSDEESSVATASTDSDSEETPGDSFQRLLELLRERSLTPISHYTDGAGMGHHATVDPAGHVARYLLEQEGRSAVDDDESDIQEGEVHPYREERRPAFPSEPVPGQRRTSYADAIDEFLNYLQAIAEDHKAHQEALTLLDEEPMPADGSDAASEAGDSAWSETASETVDSASEAGSAQTEVDSGLATSPPPQSDRETDAKGRVENGESASVPDAGGAATGTAEQSGTTRDEVSHDHDAKKAMQPGPKVETHKSGEPVEREHDQKIQDNGVVVGSDPDHVSRDVTFTNNNQDLPDTNSAISPPTSNVLENRTTVENGEVRHGSSGSAETGGSLDRPAPPMAIHVDTEGERGTTLVPTNAPPAAATSPTTAEHSSRVSQSPITDSSPARSEDSSRESSAAGSRRGSAALRSLLRASLPAVEVLGSHSDTDTLQERRASLVTGMAGDLMPPTADIQGRSPGQAGSLEMMAKSPGEVSKQPSPVDSGGASEAVSESELAHYQPVRSLASIADRLLRGDSEEDAPRVVPSDVGPSNSMAAISGQLLTDRSPGEPAGPAGMAASDEADDETELHSIIMHGEVEQDGEPQYAKTGREVDGETEIEEAKTGKVELEDDSAQKVEYGKANLREKDFGVVAATEAEHDGGEMVESRAKEVETEEKISGEEGHEKEDVGRLHINEEHVQMSAHAGQIEGEIRAEEPRDVEESERGGGTVAAEVTHDDNVIKGKKDTVKATENTNEVSPSIEQRETGGGQLKNKESVNRGVENKRHEEPEHLQKDENEKAFVIRDVSKDVDDNEIKAKLREQAKTRNEMVGKNEDNNENIAASGETGETATTADHADTAWEIKAAEVKTTTEETVTQVADENISSKEEHGAKSTGPADEGDASDNAETERPVGGEDSVAETAEKVTDRVAVEVTTDGSDGKEAFIGADETSMTTEEVAADGKTLESNEKQAALENKTQAIDNNIEHIQSSSREDDSDVYVADNGGVFQKIMQSGATSDGTSERPLASENKDNQTRKMNQAEILSKNPEESTSTTDGSPNIAIQTSTRLTLDIDGLGAVTSNISTQESYDSYYEDDGRNSENSSEHSGDSETQIGTSAIDSQVDEEKAHLEALALLESEGTDESSIQNTARTHVQEEEVMSETRKSDEPREWAGSIDNGVDPDSALSTGSAKESDSRSSVFSDLRSEASEYATGSEMDEDDYRKDRIRLTSDGESIFDDDEIFESETLTRLGVLSGTTSARKLVWSLIAMASGIVQHVHGSETKMNTSKIDSQRSAEGQKIFSLVQFEETSSDLKESNASDIATNYSPRSDKLASNVLQDQAADDENMNTISMEQLKKIYSPKVKDILKTADSKLQEIIRRDTGHTSHSAERDDEVNEAKYKKAPSKYGQHIDDSDPAGQKSSAPDNFTSDEIAESGKMDGTSLQKLKEIHSLTMKEILRAAEHKLEENIRCDTKPTNQCDKTDEVITQVQSDGRYDNRAQHIYEHGRATWNSSVSANYTPGISHDQITGDRINENSMERLKEIHGPRIKAILREAEGKCEETMGHYTTRNANQSYKADERVKQADKTIYDAVEDPIKIEAEVTNVTMEQLKEIQGAKIKAVMQTAEAQVISAAQKIIDKLKDMLSRETNVTSGHEAIGSKESNYSHEEIQIEPGLVQDALIKNNERLDVNQNLPVYSGSDLQAYLGNDIQGKSRHEGNKNVSKRPSDITADENKYLFANFTYELIPKENYESADLEKANIRWSKSDHAGLDRPSPQDIASIAVAITQSVLGEASNIVDDEQIGARRLRVRKSITHARQGSTTTEQQRKSGMEDESDVTSETPADSSSLDGLSTDAQEEPQAAPRETEGDAAAGDTEAVPGTPQADAPTADDGSAADSAPAEPEDETTPADQQVELEPPTGEYSPPLGSLSASEESDLMIDEGQDAMEVNRMRYEMGEIADQTQNVTSDEGITVEMLLAEPEEGAVMIDTEVAGETTTDKPAEDTEADEDTVVAGTKKPEPEEQGSAEEKPDLGVEVAAVEGTDVGEVPAATTESASDQGIEAGVVAADAGGVGEAPAVVAEPAGVSSSAADEAGAHEIPDSELKIDGEGSDIVVTLEKEESSTEDEITVGVDGVKVSVMRTDEPYDPLDEDLMNLPTHESNALLPTTSLRKQSSWLAKDIVAPALLAMTASGSTVEEREAFAEQMMKDNADGYDAAEDKEKKDDGDAQDILAQYAEDMELESSRETEETTESESSSGSRETLKEEEVSGTQDNVFDWLRRVSTQMDETGITDKLKEMYGEDVKKPIVMAPAEEESEILEEVPDMVSPKTAYSDTGMYHESSLSLDTSYRIRQSSTQTDAKDSGAGKTDGGPKGRKGASRHKPCGSCPCCLAMKRVVSGGEGMTGTGGVHRRSAPPKQQQQQQQQRQQRPWTSPTRSVGDLLGDASSTTVSSTRSTSSVDSGDSYAQRMKHPKRWLKQATDEFMRRECIRQVVLKNDLVSDGRIQTKVTRISRHPTSMTDCLAATKRRASLGQSLQMEISKGETVVGGRTVNYQDIKIRTPKSCSGMSVRSAPRVRSNRSAPQDDDVSKRFIDTYLSQSQAGSQSARTDRDGKESKTRKKITIKTDYRK